MQAYVQCFCSHQHKKGADKFQDVGLMPSCEASEALAVALKPADLMAVKTSRNAAVLFDKSALPYLQLGP